MGVEPTTYGTTIRCSNLLSYYHHFSFFNLIIFEAAKLVNILIHAIKNDYLCVIFFTFNAKTL